MSLFQQKVTRRDFLGQMSRMALSSAMLLSGGYTYANQIEPNWYDLVQQELRLPRLDAAFDGYRIAQLSDLHLSGEVARDQLVEAVEMVIDQRPDLAVITGDFVDRFCNLPEAQRVLVDVLRQLAAQVPVLAVMGNNDYCDDGGTVQRVLRDGGVTELAGAVQTLERGPARLHFAGLESVLQVKPDLNQLIDQLPGEQAAILLVHEPDFADQSAQTGRFDLQISGHSHGGQVVSPLVGPLVFTELGRKYVAGLYQVGDLLVYTNRGLGTAHAKVRFNCRPEITVFTLRAGKI